MQNSKVLKGILVVSGLIAMGVGGAILLAPVAFYAENGISLEGRTSLLNEVRAPGGALLVIGVLIAAGAFVRRLTFTSTLVSVLLYVAYGLSRLLSMAVDGIPAEGLVHAAGVELAIGGLGLFALVRYREVTRTTA